MNALKSNYCSQPIMHNRLNKTDMSMILQGLAPEENYRNIQLPPRSIRPNLNNLKPIQAINMNRTLENNFNVLIGENTNMEKRHSMNMLSMRRTSNTRSCDHTLLPSEVSE